MEISYGVPLAQGTQVTYPLVLRCYSQCIKRNPHQKGKITKKARLKDPYRMGKFLFCTNLCLKQTKRMLMSMYLLDLKSQGRMDAFLTKASTSTSYEGKAEDFFNIDVDTDKEALMAQMSHWQRSNCISVACVMCKSRAFVVMKNQGRDVLKLCGWLRRLNDKLFGY